MEKNRAEEILRAPTKIEVVYDARPVWITGVNGTSANVTVMGTSKTMDVPIADLKETGKYEMRLD